MAQASSVPAREPSMEEILASIRRIIEDSDTAHTPAGAGVQTPGAALAADNQEDAAGGEANGIDSSDIDAFRSELSALEPEAEPEHDLTAEAYPAFESDAPKEAEQPAAAVRPQFQAAAQPQPARAEPVMRETPAQTYEVPAARTEPRFEAPHHDEAADHAPQRASIISETAGRQVAAAFEELQDAFASSQRRSFDEIAEELMRPMLQDWLDNNLPVLVERLVREEIERVARGGVR
jgi:cell pole-organizing protein PopZ